MIFVRLISKILSIYRRLQLAGLKWISLIDPEQKEKNLKELVRLIKEEIADRDKSRASGTILLNIDLKINSPHNGHFGNVLFLSEKKTCASITRIDLKLTAHQVGASTTGLPMRPEAGTINSDCCTDPWRIATTHLSVQYATRTNLNKIIELYVNLYIVDEKKSRARILRVKHQSCNVYQM